MAADADKTHDPHGTDLTLRERLALFNGMLAFIMIYMALCAFNFGYDVGTFGGVQAMQGFGATFGTCDDSGACALPGWLSSIMTATPFLGKALGCITCGWIAEKWGRRAAILSLCIVCIVGVVLQTSATTSAQFTVGRIITFGMTGMAIVVVPIYQAETAPKQLRGMFGSTIQVMIIFGQVISTLITFGTKNMTGNIAWQIPIGLQLITPVILLVLLPFLPESPRWLISRDRQEAAEKSLRRLRKTASDEDIHMEIGAIAYLDNHDQKGSWAEVFDTNNRVRTAVAVLVMFGQQITGQAFPTQYGVIFYKSQGYGDQSFLYNVVQNIISIGAIVLTWLYIDGVGRRPVLMTGGSLMAAFLFILGSIGSLPGKDLNKPEKELMVTSLMLFQFFYNLSWAPCSYVIVSEAAAQRVKEKTNLLSCVISVLTTFVTSFTIPYLINEQYANLGGKVGFIYGAINVMMVAVVFFFIPELKGRTLEEVDQLFAMEIPLRKFKGAETRSAIQIYRKEVGNKASVEKTAETVEVA